MSGLTNTDGSSVGGLIGRIGNGARKDIAYCASNSHCGMAMVGYVDDGDGDIWGDFVYCVSDGPIVNHFHFRWWDNAYIKHCVYTGSAYVSKDNVSWNAKVGLEDNVEIQPGDVTSGKACYDMNNITGSNTFKQKIGIYDVPYAWQGYDYVYKVKEYTSCQTFKYTYTNVAEDIYTGLRHNFVDGHETCTIEGCTAPNPATLLGEKDADGFYSVGSKEAFMNLCTLVNTHNVFDLNVRLTDDIDFEKEFIAPLKEFCGEFDGGRHTLSNFLLYTSEHSPDGGLVGCLRDGSIHDLILAGYIFARTNSNIGAFAGRATSGATLYNLRNDSPLLVQGSIYAGQSEMNIGGIVGTLEGTADGCINTGSVSNACWTSNYYTQIHMAGVVGFARPTAVITKLLNTARVGTSIHAIGKAIVNYDGWRTTVPKDMFYLDSPDWKGNGTCFSADTNKGDVAVSLDQLGSGKICYQLNGSQDPAELPAIRFGQKVGTDILPTLYVSEVHPAIYNTRHYYNCTEYSDYSNSPEDEDSAGHVYTDDNPYCDKCFIIKEEAIPYVDNAYQIATAEQFQLFAQVTNMANDANQAMRLASASLTNDIVLDENTFTEINHLHGTLDGNGHTLTIDVTNYVPKSSYDNFELVRTLESTGTITRLNVITKCTQEYWGKLTCPFYLTGVNIGTISKCSFNNIFTHYFHSEPISDCISNLITDSMRKGTLTRVVAKTSEGYRVYNGHGISYHTQDPVAIFTDEEAASGALAYFISHIEENQPCVWGQILGTDSVPKIYVNQDRTSATFVSSITSYSSESPTGSTLYVNAGTPVMPGPGAYIVYSDRKACIDSYLDFPNNIFTTTDGTYSAREIDLAPTAENYLPIEVEAEKFTFSRECTEGEMVSLLFPVDMPVANINGTVYLFDGLKTDAWGKKYLSFSSDLDFDQIPANTPMQVKANGGEILLNTSIPYGDVAEGTTIHLMPMTGSKSVTIGDASHCVSYQQETLAPYNDTDKLLCYLWKDESETQAPQTSDAVATQFSSYFTIENAESSTEALEIRYSDPVASFAAVTGVLNSICSEHDGYLSVAEDETLSVYVFAGIHDGYVYGVPATEEYGHAEGRIFAGVPYIFVTDADSVNFERICNDYDFVNKTFFGDYNAAYQANEYNSLQGVLLDDGVQLHGHDYIVFTRNGLKYAPTGQYTEGEKAGQNKTVTVGRGKCFILNRQPAQASYAAIPIAVFNDETDGIEEIVNSKSSNSKCYNLQGLRVSDSYKGLVIRNGQKVLKR